MSGRGSLRARVQGVLDSLRPFFLADGGDLELVSVEDGVVTVRLLGHCIGCPAWENTLKLGIERVLRQEIPEIREVRQPPPDPCQTGPAREE
jgi:Fe-S cluster biogenesis protein NfuA